MISANKIFMNTLPRIVILCGGTGAESEVSKASGEALSLSLSKKYQTRIIKLDEDQLPEGLDPEHEVVFPVIHGTFGEDGQLQALLDEKGIEYAGSDQRSSQLCMDKSQAKKIVVENGVRVSPSVSFNDPKQVNVAELIDKLGREMVLKPLNQGSSVSLRMICGYQDLQNCLLEIEPGDWMLERRVIGREVTIGMMDNHAMGIVEVIPVGGVYDYERKYVPGSTEYKFPAVMDDEVERELKSFARKAYKACGCRDFARIDFMISEDGNPYFLEVNTIPGLTTTSLLPKSASCSGYDFDKLCHRLIEPAVNRFYERNPNLNFHAA